MKKIYTTITVFAISIVAIAQNNGRESIPLLNAPNSIQAIHKVIHNPKSVTTHAAGDTVFVFDGSYFYDWNSTLPITFDFLLEDIDGLTIEPAMQPYFGVTGSFSFFYEINPTSNLLYGHADTVFFAGATSWFAPWAQADNWFSMGPILVPATGGTLMWRHNIPDGDWRDGYEILVNTTGLNSADFTNPPIFTVADNDPATEGDTVNTPYNIFYQRSADVNAYAGQNIYIAVHHNADDEFILYITDIILIEGALIGITENNNNITSLQNIPNPAVNNTVIHYTLKEAGDVSISVFDVTGKKILSQSHGAQTAGNHQMKLDVSDITAGMYFYTLNAGSNKMTSKMTIVK